MNLRDHEFMQRALTLAEESLGLASPNPAVGCVIVLGDEVVGEAWHEYRLRDHAEVRALAAAGDKSRGATAYVSLEPCSHYGRTPPCAATLSSAGVRRVVVAHTDPNPLVSGRGIDQLRSAGVEVELLSDQAAEACRAACIIEPFACHVTTGLPLVVCKAGMSLDGKIDTACRHGGRITSEQSQAFGQQLRLQLDAVLVGVGTILADNPSLTYRGAAPKATPLIVAVLDSRLRTPPGSRIFQQAASPRVLIFGGTDAPVDRKSALVAKGAEVITVNQSPDGLELEQVLRELGKRGILGVLVEGGSTVHWSFLSASRVDKFIFIVAPIVLGGRYAVPCVGGAGYTSADSAPRFRISRTIRAGPDMVYEAYPSFSRSIVSPWKSMPSC